MPAKKELELGTRKSTLALIQATLVGDALRRIHPDVTVTPVGITTSGDRLQGTSAPGDKRDWVLEIEDSIARGSVDFAVHSGKDVPAEIHADTVILPVLERGDPTDSFVGKETILTGAGPAFYALPAGAALGTSSLRRQAQLRRLRPDLHIETVRGNVPTRIEKLRTDDSLAGIVIATAGLERLGMTRAISSRFATDELLPAVNQGTLVVQLRRSRSDLFALFQPLIHEDTRATWVAERSCIAKLGADCNSAVGVFAVILNAELVIKAQVLSAAGETYVTGMRSGAPTDAESLGHSLAIDLLDGGAAALLQI